RRRAYATSPAPAAATAITPHRRRPRAAGDRAFQAQGGKSRRAGAQHPHRGVPVAPVPRVHAARDRGVRVRAAPRQGAGKGAGMRRRAEATMRRGAEGGIAIAALFVLGAWEPFSAEQKDVRDGNERYAQKDYAGAGEAYKLAMPKLPSEPTVRFDLGAASYQAWKLAAEPPDKAKLLDAPRQNWRSAADSPQADPRLRSLAQYNLGNAAFDDGKYDAAIDAYKQALKADPRNEDARYNLELARVQKQKPPPPGGGGQKQQPQ